MARRRRRRRTKNPVKRWAANRMRRGKLDEVKLLIILGWMIWRLWTWLFVRNPTPSEVAKLAADADKFYNSRRWKALRFATLVKNEKRFGVITCEKCLHTTGPWHCDHINPRSTHPEQALDEDNVRILCEDCNVGRSDDYQQDDEPNERKAA